MLQFSSEIVYDLFVFFFGCNRPEVFSIRDLAFESFPMIKRVGEFCFLLQNGASILLIIPEIFSSGYNFQIFYL